MPRNRLPELAMTLPTTIVYDPLQENATGGDAAAPGTVAPGAGTGEEAPPPPGWMNFAPFILMFAIFWFLLIRPQMRQQKQHKERIEAIKKGDKVITQGGLLGKVIKVDETYVDVELAKDVRVKAVKHTIADIVEPGGKPAND